MIRVDVTDQPHLDPVIETLVGELEHDYAPPHIKRQAHPKMHGCVQATFAVRDDVPPELQQGIFATKGVTYRAWVRFSNAFGIEHDLKFENRGMAIKVLDVEGERLLPHIEPFSFEHDTQDFVLSTHDAFPLPNVKQHDYAEFSTAARSGLMALLKLLFRKRLYRGVSALIRGGIVIARNPLAIRYFSQTAYRLGPLAVKLDARPLISRTLATSLPRLLPFAVKVVVVNMVLVATNFASARWLLRLMGFPGTRAAAETFCDRYLAWRHLLRLALTESLARETARFEIRIQKQTDDRRMPTDDPTVRWREWRSPFVPVATLTIPRQVFWPAPGMPPRILKGTSDMMDDGERFAFNPWNGITAHEPLGDVNRARGKIYAEIWRYRSRENQLTRPVPSDEYDRLRDISQHGAMEPGRNDDSDAHAAGGGTGARTKDLSRSR